MRNLWSACVVSSLVIGCDGGGGSGGGGASSTSVSASATGPSECTSTDVSKCDDNNPCTLDACVDGHCDRTDAKNGVAPGYVDDPTDCVEDACIAGVLVQAAPDADDVPDDMNACTYDACVNGAKSFVPDPSMENAACGPAPLHCEAGICKGCASPSTCPGNDDFCQQRTCVDMICGVIDMNGGMALPASGQVANDCKKKVCNGGAIVDIGDSTDHPMDDPCTHWTCVGNMLTYVLYAGTFCSTDSLSTVTCDGNGSSFQTTCMNHLKCAANACLTACASSADCQPGFTCDTTAGTCN